ncbi:MAG: hypothetical protein HOB73_06030, partial [Planctomycetaceae bacterium]|nr:hypothetical protein [Planctomycetaceae bacterium]
EVAEDEVAEDEVAVADSALSTEQEIESVGRMVEAVAVEMELIDTDGDDDRSAVAIAPSDMDIGELVERAMRESGDREDDERYDEIEIVDEDDFEVEIVRGDKCDDDLVCSNDEFVDGCDTEEEDGLAA